jgi:hypothetical protein
MNTALLSSPTQSTVVPCISALPWRFGIRTLYRIRARDFLWVVAEHGRSHRKKKGAGVNPAPIL